MEVLVVWICFSKLQTKSLVQNMEALVGKDILNSVKQFSSTVVCVFQTSPAVTSSVRQNLKYSICSNVNNSCKTYTFPGPVYNILLYCL